MELLTVVIYISSLSVLSFFGLHYLFLLVLYLKHKDKQFSKLEKIETYPHITIQLAIYNEKYVVTSLLDAVLEIEYPADKLEIQILDDSTDETSIICKEYISKINSYYKSDYKINYIHRKDRTGFKAGALKAGLEQAKGEFIAIFDADFIPNKSFLLDMIVYFDSENIGMVQSRWTHINRNSSWLTQVQAIALDAHFALEQEVRSKGGFFCNFNGTAGIWRKSCIIDAGNWHLDTLTEDFDLSYRAQLKGWKFKYINELESPAELPSDMQAFKSQQYRWTKGAIETCIKLLPSVLRSELALKVKLEALVHLSSYLVFPFIILLALLNIPLIIVQSNSEVYNLIFSLSGLFIIPSMATTLFFSSAQKILHRDWKSNLRYYPLLMVSSLGIAINNSKAVFEAIFNIKSEFVRTPKYGTNDKKSKLIYDSFNFSFVNIIEILFTLYFMIAIYISYSQNNILAIIFQLLYLISFGTMVYYSLLSSIKERFNS